MIIAMGTMSAFLVLLLWEYYMICSYAKRLRVILKQYDNYIDKVKRAVEKQQGDVEDKKQEFLVSPDMSLDEDEVAIDSLLVINRSPEYLKASAISYVKNQQLHSLIPHINGHEWLDYTNHVAEEIYQSTHKKKRAQTASSGASLPRWRQGIKSKRSSLNGIIFSLPIDQSKFWLSSFFGPRKKPSGQWGFHHGVDMAAHRGTPVKAAASGIVKQAGFSSGYGNMVVIMHDTLYKTRYAHLDSICVKVGQRVLQNQKIGSVGDTGFTVKTGKDASHLHFELYERGKQINPLHLLPLPIQHIA